MLYIEMDQSGKYKIFRKLFKHKNDGFAMYRLFDTIIKSFNKYEFKFDYWLDYTTLLGAIRSGGIIKWDNGLYLGMFLKDIHLLNHHKFKYILEQNGLDIFCTHNRAKIYFKNKENTIDISKFNKKPPLHIPKCKFPILNIFFYKLLYGELFFSGMKWQNKLYEKHCFLYNKLGKFVEYKFGNTSIKSFENSHYYLDTIFSKNWRTCAQTFVQNQKSSECPNEPIFVKLTDELIAPLLIPNMLLDL